MKEITVITVVGARPQFVKAAAVSRAIAAYNDFGSSRISEKIVHTGQHYDKSMSQVFFDELKIPRPWRNLEVGSASHGKQTATMMERLEQLMLADPPDLLLTYGDTNSTLAAALVAAKLHIPVAHVEAGLRSYNRRMPEEINRVLTDHVSSLLFCPSQKSADNLASEGIVDGVHVVGDVMFDALLFYRELAQSSTDIRRTLGLVDNEYSVATIHRAETTASRETLAEVLHGLGQTGQQIFMPLHPRTSNQIKSFGIDIPSNLKILEPISYLQMIELVAGSQRVFTDSGGLQKEAFWLGKPCVTLRSETEWTELVDLGWNIVVGTNQDKILSSAQYTVSPAEPPPIYGKGNAAATVIGVIADMQVA